MASKKPSKRSPVTIVLEKQHREVKAIFKKLEQGSTNPASLLKELSDNLAAHMAIEQEIYYPAVKKVKPDLVLESYEEHSLAELGLKRLLATDPKDESFKARVTACKELIEHHVEEEEEDLFPAVDKKLPAAELADLAERMKTRFEQVLNKGFVAAVPKTFAKTSADATVLGSRRMSSSRWLVWDESLRRGLAIVAPSERWVVIYALLFSARAPRLLCLCPMTCCSLH